MNRFRPRSFCQPSEKLYNKPVFSLPNGKTQKDVVSKHNQVQIKYYLIFLKSESISVRIQKKTETYAAEICAGGIKILPKQPNMVPV